MTYLLNRDVIDDDVINNYFDVMLSVNSIQTNDWGVFVIVCDEMQSYLQGKSISEIAEVLQSRLHVYITEQYE